MKQKNTFAYILVAVSVIIIALVIFFAISRDEGTTENSQPAVSGTELAAETDENDNVEATVAPTAQGTELPSEIVDKVEKIKQHIMDNGFEDDDGMYYIGYKYGEDMYCSFRYDKDSDMLCAQNSYYTYSVNEEFLEVLTVLDNFPYLSSVEYYEDFYVAEEEDLDKANSAGTFVAIAGYSPEELTSESSLQFFEMETSTYEYEDLDAALNIADQYAMMSFSLWDEVLELEFGYNLKDFGFTNFVRDDFESESAE